MSSDYNKLTFEGFTNYELELLLLKTERENHKKDTDFIETIKSEMARRNIKPTDSYSYPLKTFISLDWRFSRGGNLGPLDQRALEFLYYRGVHTIINLMAENNEEQDLVRRFGFYYHYFPIKDFAASEKIETMDEIIEIIMKGQPTTFVHCNGGRGRSGMVETCYIIKVNRIPFPDALRFTLRRSKFMDDKDFEYSKLQVDFMKNYWQRELQKAQNNVSSN